MTKRLHASLLTRLFFRIGIALLVALILALTLHGRAFYGSALGTITDQSAGLSGVTVTLTNVRSGEVHKTRSGTVGATVEVAAQAAQIRDDRSAVTHATGAQVINDVPDVTQNALFCAMLQNGVQPRSETSTSTLGGL